MNTLVFANLQFEGLHCWPDCNLKEVSFLKQKHRHMFHITVYKEVNHLNRDVEFIVLKRKVLQFLHNKYPNKDMGSTSCEMLAELLINTFALTKVSVSEDGENGAIVEQDKI